MGVETVGFVAAQLFEPTLPADYGALLEALRAFATAPPQSDQAFRADHAALMAEGRALAASTDPIPRPAVLRAFAAGALRATRLARTVEGGPPRPPTSLDRWRPDLNPEDESSLRAALDDLLSRADWADVDARVERGDEALARRRSVSRALHGRFPSDHPKAVHEAFSALFVDHPLAVGEVSWIRTATSTFFLVPFSKAELTSPSAPVRPRREALDRFLAHLTRFEQRYFAHFPVFGGFRGEHADAELLASLAAATGLAQDDVAHQLTTSVSVIPRDEVDKYLVHDAWGHVWQALLFRFDESYQAAATYGEPPGLDARYGDASLLEVAAACARGEPEPSPEAFLRDCLHQRLHVSLAGLMAEVLADAVEGKISGAPLPSSSRLPEEPTRLDLTLSDLPYYVQVATRGVEKLARHPEALEAVLSPHLSPAEAQRAALRIAEAARPLVEEVFAPSFLERRGRESGPQLPVNVFDRLALNFLGFQ
ncbi:MAG: hypothetical protein AAFU79_11965, partial [Myxococcota bacterium]